MSCRRDPLCGGTHSPELQALTQHRGPALGCNLSAGSQAEQGRPSLTPQRREPETKRKWCPPDAKALGERRPGCVSPPAEGGGLAGAKGLFSLTDAANRERERETPDICSVRTPPWGKTQVDREMVSFACVAISTQSSGPRFPSQIELQRAHWWSTQLGVPRGVFPCPKWLACSGLRLFSPGDTRPLSICVHTLVSSVGCGGPHNNPVGPCCKRWQTRHPQRASEAPHKGKAQRAPNAKRTRASLKGTVREDLAVLWCCVPPGQSPTTHTQPHSPERGPMPCLWLVGGCACVGRVLLCDPVRGAHTHIAGVRADTPGSPRPWPRVAIPRWGANWCLRARTAPRQGPPRGQPGQPPGGWKKSKPGGISPGGARGLKNSKSMSAKNWGFWTRF